MISNAVEESKPLIEQIREIALSGEVCLPPLPAMGMRLLEMFQDEDRLNAKDVAELVQQDPAMATALLRIANSAMFGGLQKISDLSQAIARLGMKRVGSMLTTMMHKGQFEGDKETDRELLEILWGHSIATAIAARRLSEVTGGDPEESYLAGLLHDTGKLLVLRAVDHLQSHGKSMEINQTVLYELLDGPHAELGHLTLSNWQLPEPICDAVRYHHHMGEEMKDWLVARVQAADAIARKIGAHYLPEPNLDLEEIPAFDVLNMSEIELVALTVDLEDEIKVLKALV